MNFKVYQIIPTRKEIEDYNNGKPSARVAARRNMGLFFDNAELRSETAKMLREGLYDHVADIVDASNLEDAFFLGQGGREPAERLAHIKMQAESMMSVSMGDILVDEDDNAFVVAQWGFYMLPEKITA